MFTIFTVALPQALDLQPLKLDLESLGYQIFSYSGTEEVLSEVKSLQPDLVLMAPMLSEGEGLKACEQLKSDPETEMIPVIFVGPEVHCNGSRLRCFESGATDFISQDMDEKEVVLRLQTAIRNKQVLSQAATLARQLNEMNAELYERNLQIEKGLYITRQLQQSLLPPFLPEREEPSPEGFGDITAGFSKRHYQDDQIRISGVYLPCDLLGGDIYDVIRFPNDTIGVAIADVSGHGVPAGFITAIFKSSFYRVTHNHSAPGDILSHLNNELADIVKTGDYVTAVYCRILPEHEPERRLLEYSGAGHPYPIYYQAETKQVFRLKENGTPLVWIKDMEYPTGRILLSPGDKVLLFTDGVSEMRNASGGLYGEDALEQLFMEQLQQHSHGILEGMIRQLSDFTEGHPLEDDFSAVLIEMD